MLVCGVLAPRGPSGRLLGAVRRRRFVLVTSPALLDELVDVLLRPRMHRHARLSFRDVARLRAALELAADVVPGVYQVEMVARDPDDDVVVGCALEGDAGFLVTEDKAVRQLKVIRVAGHRPVQIVRPSDFLPLLRRR